MPSNMLATPASRIARSPWRISVSDTAVQ